MSFSVSAWPSNLLRRLAALLKRRSITLDHRDKCRKTNMSNEQETPVAVLGVPIDNVNVEQILTRFNHWIDQGGFHQVATANTDFLIHAQTDGELEEILRRCDLVMADGMPLVWTSKLLGTPLKGRVTGVDLVPRIAALSAERGYRIFMLGASERSLNGAARKLEADFPGVQIVDRFSPVYAPLDEMDHEAILARIEAAAPHFLLVAFGNPKQEKWLSMHRHRLRVPVCIGIGGSFDFLAGTVSRAPLWMQRNGLEWLYRTIQEPRRLARRYAANAVGLARHLPGQMAGHTLQAKQSLLPRLTSEVAGESQILRVIGDFTGPVMQRFEEEAVLALLQGTHVVLDLSRSSFIGPDAMGLLIRMVSKARLFRRELWLTGLRPLMHRTVRAARLGPSLQIASGVAEALRRIEPANVGLAIESGRDWAVARFGARLVSFPVDEPETTKGARGILQGHGTFRRLIHGTSAMSQQQFPAVSNSLPG
jgi:N-acetylglucosaminyldiphosphoundecaprenol N-acetyl-beta-D-mannosaminyltransferase